MRRRALSGLAPRSPSRRRPADPCRRRRCVGEAVGGERVVLTVLPCAASSGIRIGQHMYAATSDHYLSLRAPLNRRGPFRQYLCRAAVATSESVAKYPSGAG